MTLTVSVSQKELERVAALAYEGETLKAMLCSVGATGYTAQSTLANWESVEASGNGYVRFSAVIAVGAWSGTAGAYVMPDIDADFTATGVGYTYDTVVVYIEGATYPYCIITESPNIALANGQTQTYRISLRQDD